MSAIIEYTVRCLKGCLGFTLLITAAGSCDGVQVVGTPSARLEAGTPSAGPRMVVGWKFVPMNYQATQSVEEMRQDDIRSAMEMGLDGFALEAYTYGHAKELMREWPEVAERMGAKEFKFFLVLDMGPSTFTAQNIIDLVETYGSNAHYMKLGGRPLVSTYNAFASGLGNDWWKNNVLNPLAMRGHAITFVPYFDRSDPNGVPPTFENWNSLIQQFPDVNGLLLFSPAKGVPFYLDDPNGGHQTWSGLETEENEAEALHQSGKYFISPYQPYYWENCKGERPYYEYQGGRGMDNYWRSAIFNQQPEMVSLITWDDYSESTFVQPTRTPNSKYPGIHVFPHLAYYELEKYYISWYKNGVKPKLTKDAIFFFYRTHKNNAIATNDLSACPLGPIPVGQKWGLVNDVLFVTTALTDAADLVVRTGNKEYSVSVAAGVTTTNIKFEIGEQVFELRRNGVVLTQILGDSIVEKPEVYNFNLTSGYAVVGGGDSLRWRPTDRWKEGFIADWFTTKD